MWYYMEIQHFQLTEQEEDAEDGKQPRGAAFRFVSFHRSADCLTGKARLYFVIFNMPRRRRTLIFKFLHNLVEI